MTETFACVDCHAIKEAKTNHCGTGYADCPDGKVCYDCCAARDEKFMTEHGKITMYLTLQQCELRGTYRPMRNSTIPNWPGTLRFVGIVRTGRHNMAGKRYDVWFSDNDGKKWHGVTYGDNTQLCHCKRLK